jgi:hypothetical protein
LVSATKYWLPENRVHEPGDVVLAIYGVIDGFIKRGNRTCVIKSDEHNSPGPIKETKMVMVRCGLESLMIFQIRLADSVSVEVSEVLSKPTDNEPRIVE